MEIKMAPFKNLTLSITHVSVSPTHIVASSVIISLFLILITSSSLSPHSPISIASAFTSTLLSAANLFSPVYPASSPSNACLVVADLRKSNCTLSAVAAFERRSRRRVWRKNDYDLLKEIGGCDLFDGDWLMDNVSAAVYEPGSCPFVEDKFNCHKNGKPDSGYLRYKWKPHGCKIPRFNGKKMLGLLRGKRLVFVGDSLNRNMWESLVCALRESLRDKRRIFQLLGLQDFKTQGFYSFRFIDYRTSIDFVKSRFLVQESQLSETDRPGRQKNTLRLDMIPASSSSNYQEADIIIFNTGHWWTHQKLFKRYCFQEGNHVYHKLHVLEAYTKALQTWARWVDSNINSTRTRVFFNGYSSSHFSKGKWNSGGRCDDQTQPIRNETQLPSYPLMMKTLESVISEMKTPVLYLNISKMTAYRQDGHPSTYRQHQSQSRQGKVQDCSHWCLPGVPDSWNELLYATLLVSRHALA